MAVKKKLRSNISLWVVIGAIVVVAIMAAVMTLVHFQRQQEQAIELLVEKGATLIRSFEAGLRTPANREDSEFGLQKLLMETAQQPDIDYLIVTDNKGKIIADSDPSSVGDEYGLDLDITSIASAKIIRWRQVANLEGAGTFEVYRGFFPQERISEAEPSPSPVSVKNNMIIYVGFNMAAIEKAASEDTRNTVIIASILLLIGSSAIILLILAQAYRLTRTSLSRITAFSEALVKHMPIGLIAFDASNRIITCNEQAGIILNIPCAEVLEGKTNLFLPPALRNILTELPEHGGLVEKDLQLILEQGKNKILEAVVAGLMEDGTAAGKIIIFRDVTAMRQLESEVVKSRHLNSIASLAAGVAHEIRNPLSSIKGFAVYFKERLAGNTEDQKVADIMIQEVERLNRVISQLIEFARPLELKLQKVNFPEIVQNTMALIAAEAQKNQISLAIDSNINLPPVDSDPDKIKQVLLNIFLNAIAAMKSGGTLSVSYTEGSDQLEVLIADTGVGIEDMDLPRIYDPYFTSKPAGTGLGLAVVQKIMEAHHGLIVVESTAGKGTTVRLRFPLSQNYQINKE